MTIPETLAPSHGEATRLIRQRGLVVLIDYHPFMLLKGVPTHFEAPTSEPIAIANTVHLFTDHIRGGAHRRACSAGVARATCQRRMDRDEPTPFWRAAPSKPFGPPGQLWDGAGPR